MTTSQPAFLLRDFVNTYDIDGDADELGAPSDLSVWLYERDLVPPGTRADESDLAVAVALREGLRAAMRGHNGPPPGGPPTHRPPTEPPATDPPPTDPPRTETPRTEPPRTEPPATEPPATEQPVTHRPPTNGSVLPATIGLPAELDDALAHLVLRVSFGAGMPELVPPGTGARAGLARIAAAIIASRADGTWPRLKACQEGTCQWVFLDTSKNRSRSWCSMRICGNRTKTRAYRARRREGAR